LLILQLLTGMPRLLCRYTEVHRLLLLLLLLLLWGLHCAFAQGTAAAAPAAPVVGACGCCCCCRRLNSQPVSKRGLWLHAA
jgi:hypothetical protein